MKLEFRLRKISVITVIAVLLFASSGARVSSANGDVYYVNTGGWYDGDPATATYHPSSTPIQSCINNASAGTLIRVFDGVYTENIIVNQSVTLRSYDADPSNCTIRAASSSSHVVLVMSPGVTVEGLTLTGGWNPYQSSGVLINASDNCAVHNCVINSCIYGVWIQSSSNASVGNNVITNITYYAVLVSVANRADIFDNKVSGCPDGISAWGGAVYDTTIRQNNVTGGDVGIWIYNAQRSNVTGNAVSNATIYGIKVDSAVNTTTVTDNYLRNNANNTFGKGNSTWDHNFYSDYSGVDSNRDGIGDTPYSILGGISQDMRPIVPVVQATGGGDNTLILAGGAVAAVAVAVVAFLLLRGRKK